MGAFKNIIEKNGLNIPYSCNTKILTTPFMLAGKNVANRIAVVVPCGCDAEPGGSFGIYSHRRYARYAGCGAGIIFFEPAAISYKLKQEQGQLCICPETFESFKKEIDFIRNLSERENGFNPVLILRLSGCDFAGEYSLVSKACALAESAGFDGVEIASHCKAFDKKLFISVKNNVKDDFIIAARITACDDMADATRLVFELKSIFAEPLVTFDLEYNKKQIKQLCGKFSLISSLQKQNTDITVMTAGYSAFGSECVNVAAGAISDGVCKIVGFSKQAVAYPSFIKDLRGGGIRADKCCIMCGKCEELRRAGFMSGCVVHDSEIYLPCYEKLCRVRTEQLN